MLSTVFLSALLMLGGLGGVAAAANFQVYGKSVYSDNSLLSGEEGRHRVRRQPQLQSTDITRRSLDLERLNMHVTPTISKSSRPSIIKLYPPTVNPHIHANMPMRFGREVDPEEERSPNSPNMPMRFGRKMKPGDDRSPNSPDMPMRFGRQMEPEGDSSPNSPNLPQRFGRAWKLNRVCVECPGGANRVLPVNSLYWSLLNSMAVEQFFNADWHWAEDFDLNANAEEFEMEQK